MTETCNAGAPWQLTGRGYAIALHCSRAFGEACQRSCPGFEGQALGGMGTLMMIDYASSNVGPYQELLLSPGTFRIGRRRLAAITHIWVSTDTSAHNGRRNWGLPKQTAIFDNQRHGDGSETFTVRHNDSPPLTLTFTSRGPAPPVNTRILPPSWRTLEQPWHGQLYRTRISAHGRTRLARLSGYDNPEGSGFPDFASQTRILSLSASTFELVFPIPHISCITSA